MSQVSRPSAGSARMERTSDVWLTGWTITAAATPSAPGHLNPHREGTLSLSQRWKGRAVPVRRAVALPAEASAARAHPGTRRV